VSLWQYGSSPGTGFQQPVGCSCGCPRRLLSAADYRGCSAPETATVTAPAANTPTVSKGEGVSTPAGACARVFSAEQIEIVKQHYGLAETETALETCQWLTNDDIGSLAQGGPSDGDVDQLVISPEAAQRAWVPPPESGFSLNSKPLRFFIGRGFGIERGTQNTEASCKDEPANPQPPPDSSPPLTIGSDNLEMTKVPSVGKMTTTTPVQPAQPSVLGLYVPPGNRLLPLHTKPNQWQAPLSSVDNPLSISLAPTVDADHPSLLGLYVPPGNSVTTTTPPPASMTIIVPSAAIGRVLGHNGTTIQRIQAVSGAKVRVEAPKLGGSFFSQTGLPFTIVGTPGQIAAAESRIQSVLALFTGDRLKGKIQQSTAAKAPRTLAENSKQLFETPNVLKSHRKFCIHAPQMGDSGNIDQQGAGTELESMTTPAIAVTRATSDGNGTGFLSTVEINDLSLETRRMVARKLFHREIESRFDCTVTCRGTYIAQGDAAFSWQEKLRLEIVSTSKPNTDETKQEIIDTIHESERDRS